MELLILNRHDLSYKDHAYLDDNSTINVDIYLLQKSKLIVNKKEMNAAIGDVLLIKNGTSFLYLGVIDTITKTSDFIIEIEAYEFKAMFNIDIVARNLNGKLTDYLTSIFNDYFIQTSDEVQRLSYLEIRSLVNINGELLFNEDTVINLNTLLEQISKTYEIGFISYPVIINGRVSKIALEVVSSNREIVMKYKTNLMRNLVVKLNENQMLNKITFTPKSSNVLYKATVNYYLLQTNEITMYSDHIDRFDLVVSKIIFYKDGDYQNLFTTAYNEFKSTLYSHKISFDVFLDNSLIAPLIDFKLGDIIEFIIENKVYKTIFSAYQLNIRNNTISITLGDIRTKLTDKLKLLDKENRK